MSPDLPGVLAVDDGTAERKRAVWRERAAAKKARREARRIHRRCFWTPPIGHVWEYVGGSDGYGYWNEKCVGCGWVKTRWSRA